MTILQLIKALLSLSLVFATIHPSSCKGSSSASSSNTASGGTDQTWFGLLPQQQQQHVNTNGGDDVVIPIAYDASLTIIPSIHRHTQKYETIQRHLFQRTVEAVVDATTSVSKASRSNSIQRICSPDANGVVFPDDDFNIQLFHNDAEPMCSCYEQDNTDLVLLSFVNDKSANVTEYLHKLNKAFSRIVGLVEYDCTNTCEHCFTTTRTVTNTRSNASTTFCGRLQTNESSTYRGTEGNFSMQEYSTGKITAASWERLFSESSFSVSTCIEYTQNEVGTLCYGSHFSNLSATPTCYVQYNDTLCQSCTFPYSPVTDVNVTNNDCFIVDCTNIVPNASVINTCTGTGYDGIFRFVEWIENGISSTTPAITRSVSVGSCDGPPTLVPTIAPLPPAPLPPVAVQEAASSPTIKSHATTTIYRTTTFLPVITLSIWIISSMVLRC